MNGKERLQPSVPRDLYEITGSEEKVVELIRIGLLSVRTTFLEREIADLNEKIINLKKLVEELPCKTKRLERLLEEAIEDHKTLEVFEKGHNKVKIQLWQGQVKRILIDKNSEVPQLAKKINISLGSEAVHNIITLGMKMSHLDTHLKNIVEELEEKKKLESDFQEIAVQTSQLEARYVGTRNQIAKVYRDNRALSMHLCTYSPRNERERRLRERLIEKYVIDAKLA